MGRPVLPCSLLVVLLLDPAALGQNGMNQTHPAYTVKEGSTATVSGNFSVASTPASTGSAVSTSQVRSATTTSQGTGLALSTTPNLSVLAANQFTETSTVAVFHDSSTSLGSTSRSTSQEAIYPAARPSPEAETPATASHTSAPATASPATASHTSAPATASPATASHTSAPAQASGSPATPAEGRPPTPTPADGPPHTDMRPTQPPDSSLTMVAFGMMSFILILIVITAILVTTVNLKGRCGTVKENGKTNSDSVVSESNANGEKESITLVSIRTINAETGSDRASSAPGTRFDVELRQDLPNTKLV